MRYDVLMEELTRAVEIVGVAVLLVGAVLASAVFLRRWWLSGLDDAYQRYRADLGRAILLGLEVLIVADIISTMAVEPTLDNLSVLAFIVLIRTFLSFALEIEITGRLPWRHDPHEAPHAPPPD